MMTIWAQTRSALYWLPSAVVLSTYFYNVKKISGRSMQPSLNPNTSLSKDMALFDRSAVQAKDYARGDIVTLRSPEDPNRLLVKRILALEGDVVKTLPPYPAKEVVVPEGYIWVEGDEPFFSDDSNRFGPISASLLESKLVMLLWPPDRFGPLQVPQPPTNDLGPTNHLASLLWEKEQRRTSRVQRSNYLQTRS